MEVKLVEGPTEKDWLLMKKCTLVTVGKETEKAPTEEFRKKMIESGHSPIRVLNFCFFLKDIPYWVSVHLVRHVHAIPFVKTQRNDRQEGYDRTKAPQDAPVDMMWYMNAEELITIAHKRLCGMASPETRDVVREMCNLVIEKYPEFKNVLVPMCAYRNGACSEPNPCGLYKTYKS